MMPRFFGLFLLAAASLALPAWSQELHIIPVPPHVQPQWTPLPANPRVAYAPNVPTDVFRYRSRYYLYWEGSWYRSKNIRGPWKATTQVPPALAYLDTKAFKQAAKAQAAPSGPPSGFQITPPPSPPGTAGPPPAPPGEAPAPPSGPPGEPLPLPKMM